VRLAIYDCRGRLVATLVDENKPEGSDKAVRDGRDSNGAPVSSGFYFARLEIEYGARTKKVVVAR
jgi:flagellar hook assembly protein FlgD